ncbi:glycosyltransferase family 4 protein [Oceanirhabdus sp. W0125-5]|uniref:glycosyltransferase family 4 protein n=1 Tax=Oceanirhabdus sp. W0125-5 TaxID=2999116 RepID=UPI0022F3264A|nr:glycosyltransferase [Oceanirhabdus sp. W0125-5]WBW99455.1 glycosyltransferase [Oceanirhabdus sp. W0125-5]
MVNYCVLYPNTSNVNLVKDMGMIPYKLHDSYGYNSWIACYNQDKYSYLNDEVKGLKIEFLKKTFNNYILDGCLYLIKNSKKIDILQIFHMTSYSVAYSIVYKFFNRKGKIYLKLDCSEKLIERLDSMNYIERKIIKAYLKRVDIISAEQERLIEPLNKRFGEFGNKLIHITNGVDLNWIKNINNNEKIEKENCFLHVARLGAEEKKTENILKAFKIFSKNNTSWKLLLVGAMEDNFKKFYNKFLEENEELRDRILYKGEIIKREELYNIYKKSKAFILNSKFESFGFVLIEAALFNNMIISTDVGVAEELRVHGNVEIIKYHDIDSIKNAMVKVSNDKDVEKKGLENKQLIEKKYSYDVIIKKLKFFFDKIS